MGSIKNSLQQQINNNNRGQFFGSSATILSYDKTTETCKIKYPNPNGEGYIYRGNVSVAGNLGGVSSGGIFGGQECIVSFINGNVYSPIIVSITNSYYAERSNADQGAYIADDEVYKVGTPEHIIAMDTDWLNMDAKYNDLGFRYSDIDIDNTSMDLITTLDKVDDNEVGLVNLSNKSTIKLRDNGDIDLFTSNNTGIRICKSGNIKLYGTDIEFTDSKSETTDKSISTQLKVAQIMKICLAYDIIKEVDGYVSTINESVDNSTKLNGDETHGNKQK